MERSRFAPTWTAAWPGCSGRRPGGACRRGAGLDRRLALAESSLVVSVFGGSRVARGSDEYEAARLLGRRLAECGFVVCNGGYDGTMEAASRGAKEVGGRTIGVTVDLFGGA